MTFSFENTLQIFRVFQILSSLFHSNITVTARIHIPKNTRQIKQNLLPSGETVRKKLQESN